MAADDKAPAAQAAATKADKAPAAQAAATKADKAPAAKAPALKVKARERGYYNGLLVEEGEHFENTLGLEVYPTDKHAWFEAVTAKKADPDEA